MFSKRDDERRTGRASSRTSKRNRLFWTGASELLRLEPRTMLSLSVTTFPIPLVGIIEPQGITTGPDGNLWFAETAANKIGRMTPSGALTQFSLPAIPAGSQPDTGSGPPGPVAITVGPDGALWFVGVPGEIGRITTAGLVTEFPVPDVPPPPGSPPGTPATPATFTSITAGPDGALWFMGVPGEIGRITTSGVVTEFPVPALAAPPDSVAPPPTVNGIVAGPDGALWFAGVPGEIGRITTSGVVTEFPVPDAQPPAGSPAPLPGTVVTPTSITMGPDGALWFTAPTEGQTGGGSWLVGRITTAGAVSEFPTSIAISSPIVTGPDGNLWFSDNNDLYRITPSGVITTFSEPANVSYINGLTPGPGGKVWFTISDEVDGSLVGQQPAIGEITPAGATTLFNIPKGTTLDPSRGIDVNPTAIATARDGAMWFVDNAGFGRITSDGKLKQFALTTSGATARYIATGPDDTMWFAQEDEGMGLGLAPWSIGRITARGSITSYSLPANVGSIYDIAEAPDGDLWFTAGNGNDSLIERVTPKGKFTSFPINSLAEEAITIGPNRNTWFSGVVSGTEAGGAAALGIGEVTSKGQVKIYDVPATMVIDSLISGPGGDLWFGGQSSETMATGLGRISTGGKSGSTIPAGPAIDLTRGPDGRVWFLSFGQNGPLLGVATRSGIVVTQDPPGLNWGASGGGIAGAENVMTFGPHGSLWLTDGTSSIERISGLNTVLGALDYRGRPEAAPNYVQVSYAGTSVPGLGFWTNTTTSAQPTFAGVAKPGAEVTLWAQKQGQYKPILIGRAAASMGDGAWTLRSRVKLSSGEYAVTASQSGHTGPLSVLYSLKPDASGNLSNALVIQAPSGG
jgi:streptogramin lyase